jgi:hypothetical protein
MWKSKEINLTRLPSGLMGMPESFSMSAIIASSIAGRAKSMSIPFRIARAMAEPDIAQMIYPDEGKSLIDVIIPERDRNENTL